MRVLKEISNASYRTTIFNWNNKYIIKIETTSFEQTYKVDQLELTGDEEAIALLDSEFMKLILSRFDQMAVDMGNALSRLNN